MLISELTPRERAVIELVTIGKQNKQISYMLSISSFAVQNHLRAIYQKLSANNRTHAVFLYHERKRT